MSESTQPTALLFGLGSIGGIYAVILSLAGASVSVVARSNYDAVKEKGFDLKSSKFGDHHVTFDGVFKSTADAAASGKKFDYILCANKALLDAVPSLSDHLRLVISPSTSIVLLQNGVGAEDPLHASFPLTTIISAVVWTGGRVLPPTSEGVAGVEQFNREGLTIGVDYRKDAGEEGKKVDEERLERLVATLGKGGGDCTVTKEIQTERWVKVIWNCTWNALTCVTRIRTNHIFGSSEPALPLSRQIMEEVSAVARAKGLVIPEGTVDKLMKQCTDVGGPGLPSSMMFDCEAGRPTEVEVILGTPMREGQRLGVPVPILTTLYTIIKALDWRNAHLEEATKY